MFRYTDGNFDWCILKDIVYFFCVLVLLERLFAVFWGEFWWKRIGWVSDHLARWLVFKGVHISGVAR